MDKPLKQLMIEFRARERLSQRNAAELAGISLQTWYSIEKGYQTPSAITETKIRMLID